MNVLIVEDEGIAADRLERLVTALRPKVRILEQLDTVKSAVSWFQTNEMPDLLFFDIHLADGSSFEIFEQVNIHCPVIFTTAYDQYAIKAFEVNSVDYLLKPIEEQKLEKALSKFESLNQPNAPIDVNELKSLIQGSQKKYKERFVVKVGEHLRSIPVDQVDCFYSEEGATYLLDAKGQRVIVDYALDQLSGLVDPGHFFRINRKFIIRMSAIQDIVSYSNSRLKIALPHLDNNELIVSRDRVGEFKSWLDC
ncbi:LytR/AlgR family response regulator transcription factor [Reichenbachiella ulvae]|uniref:LytTR family DNA-binding domain-containing protein n=1 Tax=Reichenbachiella ulvae TaxID=2980104 RepID=A0ABT3CQ36_9BACT|nr:LytTR family DNA-binding domain-containing protein [Reichenbachiella ulvae]MCV9385575.1 LytTR family DNA-binding domain-containing protein [Reichenbachiella ulvae]